MQKHSLLGRGLLGRALVLALSLVLATVALASPRNDAWSLRRSDPTAALSQLQQVVQADPNDSKAFYYMAIINEDLGQRDAGLQALENAVRVDPQLSFTNNPNNVPRLRAALNSHGGAMGTGSDPAQSMGGSFSREEQQQILNSLSSSGVYVSPAMANVADASALQNAVKDHPHGAKVLVLDKLPQGASIGAFAKKLHTALNMKDGLLVVASGQPRQVAAYGGSLVNNPKELNQLVQTNAATFTSQGYTAGIQAILAAHKAQEAEANRSGSVALLFLIGVPTAGGVWYFRRKKAREAARELKLREESRTLSNELAPAYEKLDSDFEYAVLGAQNDADKQRELREARSRAGAAFSNAMRAFNDAQTFNSLVSARAALIRAHDEMERSRAILEGKPLPVAAGFGATGSGGGVGSMLPPDMQRDQAIQSNGFEIPPLGGGYAGARSGQALDFFTSKPVPLNDMVPVDIQINGEPRRVWASRESAQAAINGNVQVATVNQGGQQVPWYNAANQYNPWQDFGSTMVNMMMWNMMMNTMFQPAYGYGGYHHDHFGGYGWNDGWNGGGGYDTNVHDNAGSWDNSGAGVGDLDIFGSTGGNDNSGAGVADLDLFGGGGGDSGGFDFGGGGGDFGGFDGS